MLIIYIQENIILSVMLKKYVFLINIEVTKNIYYTSCGNNTSQRHQMYPSKSWSLELNYLIHLRESLCTWLVHAGKLDSTPPACLP